MAIFNSYVSLPEGTHIYIPRSSKVCLFSLFQKFPIFPHAAIIIASERYFCFHHFSSFSIISMHVDTGINILSQLWLPSPISLPLGCTAWQSAPFVFQFLDLPAVSASSIRAFNLSRYQMATLQFEAANKKDWCGMGWVQVLPIPPLTLVIKDLLSG